MHYIDMKQIWAIEPSLVFATPEEQIKYCSARISTSQSKEEDTFWREKQQEAFIRLNKEQLSASR